MPDTHLEQFVQILTYRNFYRVPPGQRDREVLEAIREHQPLFRINTLLHVEHSNIRDLDDAENRRRSSYSAAIALNSSFRPPMRRVSPGGEYSGFLQVAVRVGVD